MTHTLSYGAPQADKYGQWGSSGQTYDTPPEKLLALLLSFAGEGKTEFTSSNPGALVLNFDLSGTKGKVEAQVLPVPSGNGSFVGPDGNAFVWTFDRALEIKRQLIDAAKNNRLRPTTIILDTFTAMIRLAQTKYGFEFNNQGDVYDECVSYILELRDAGYGVWVNAHLTKKTIKSPGAQLGDPPILVDGIAYSEKLHYRLMPHLNLILQLYSEKEAFLDEEPRFAVDKAGQKTKVGTIKSTKFRRRYYLALDNEYLAKDGSVKRRVSLPDRIELTGSNTWETFCSVYRAAMAQKDSA